MPAKSKRFASYTRSLQDQDAISLLNDLPTSRQFSINDIKAIRAKRNAEISDGEWIHLTAMLRGDGFIEKKQDGYYQMTNKGINFGGKTLRTQFRAEIH